MLYVTTRSNQDVYTTNRALTENRAQDGGLYLPYKMPAFSQGELLAFAEKPFNQRMADILNLLFRSKLTGWDIDFCVGRYPVRLKTMSHRIVIGESWHNPGWTFDWMANRLTGHLRGRTEPDELAGDWPMIAVRIAVLFGIFGELLKNGEIAPNEEVDVAVASGDLSGAMGVYYARMWGLPIGTIIICTNDNAFLWDLLHRGELKTGSVAVRTATPLCDRVLPRDLERLICAAGGPAEVARYLDTCARGGTYVPNSGILEPMRQGIHVSVVSGKRMLSAMPNLYRGGYISGPYTALCHSGLQDYRARTGESRPALVISERSPGCDEKTVAAAMGITLEELKDRIKNV